MYAGSATKLTEMTKDSVVSYNTLIRLQETLDKNRAPKNVKVIAGSTFQDTRTTTFERVLYAGTEAVKQLRQLKDNFDKPAFIETNKYAGATKLLDNEVGTIAGFRVIAVEDMIKHEGVGGAETDDSYWITDGKLDVFPMLVISDKAFSTIGLQSSGRKGDGSKYKVYTKKPGESVANRDDPYGKTGFCSIQVWYGFLPKQPEHIAVLYTVGKY